MATLSHEAFRRLVERFGGCDEYYTEMINAGTLLTRGPFEKFYLMNGPVPEKIVWQLTGNKADSLAAAAQVVTELGGIGVDLNMGCSAPEIFKSGAGIAWMCKPLEETRLMVAGVRSVLEQAARSSCKSFRLSVKLRLGNEDFTDESFFSFCHMLADEGVTRLVLHPRTRREKYTRPPRWTYVERLACSLEGQKVSVVLNGAVRDTASARAALSAAPHADGIMIARAAVQKPWIFAELKQFLSAAAVQDGETAVCGGRLLLDLQQLALDYLADLEKYQPPEFWKTRAQRFFAYFCDNFSFAHYAKTQLLNAVGPAEVCGRLTEYFEKVPEDRYLSVPSLSLSHV